MSDCSRGGTLRSQIPEINKDQTRIKNNQLRLGMITIQIIRALTHLHKNNIIHRDLKSQNIIMERPLRFYGVTNVIAKLSDYGFAYQIGDVNENQYYCGDDEYIAPELITQFLHNKSQKTGEDKYKVQFSKKSDIWSIGIVVYEMFTGQPPFISS